MWGKLVKSRTGKGNRKQKATEAVPPTPSSFTEDDASASTHPGTAIEFPAAVASNWAEQWDAVVDTITQAAADAENLYNAELASNACNQSQQHRYSNLVKATQQIQDPYSRSNSIDALLTASATQNPTVPAWKSSPHQQAALERCQPPLDLSRLGKAGVSEQSLKALRESYSAIDVVAASQQHLPHPTQAVPQHAQTFNAPGSLQPAARFSETDLAASKQRSMPARGSSATKLAVGGEVPSLPTPPEPPRGLSATQLPAAALDAAPSLPRAPSAVHEDMTTRLQSYNSDSASERTPRGRHRRGKPIEGNMHWERRLEPLAGGDASDDDLEAPEREIDAPSASPPTAESPLRAQRFTERHLQPEVQSMMLSRPEPPPGGYIGESAAEAAASQQFTNPMYTSAEAAGSASVGQLLGRSVAVERSAGAPDWSSAAAVLTDVESHNTSRDSSVTEAQLYVSNSNGEGDYRAALAAATAALPSHMPDLLPPGMPAPSGYLAGPARGAPATPSHAVQAPWDSGVADSPPSGGIRVRNAPFGSRGSASSRFVTAGAGGAFAMETVPECEDLPPGTPLDGSTESSSTGGRQGAQEEQGRTGFAPLSRGASEAAAASTAMQQHAPFGRSSDAPKHRRSDSGFFQPLSRGASAKRPSTDLIEHHSSSAPSSRPGSLPASGASSPRTQRQGLMVAQTPSLQQAGLATVAAVQEHVPVALAPPVPGALPEPLQRVEQQCASQAGHGSRVPGHHRQPSNAHVDAYMKANAPGHYAYSRQEMAAFEAARRGAEAPRHRRTATMDPTNDPSFFSPLSQGKAMDTVAYSSVAKAVYRDVSGPLGIGVSAPYADNGSGSRASSRYGSDQDAGTSQQPHAGMRLPAAQAQQQQQQFAAAQHMQQAQYRQQHSQPHHAQAAERHSQWQQQGELNPHPMHSAGGAVTHPVPQQGGYNRGPPSVPMHASQQLYTGPQYAPSPPISRTTSISERSDVQQQFGSNMAVEEIDYPAGYGVPRSDSMMQHSAAGGSGFSADPRRFSSQQHGGHATNARGFGSDFTTSSAAMTSGHSSFGSGVNASAHPPPAATTAQPAACMGQNPAAAATSFSRSAPGAPPPPPLPPRPPVAPSAAGKGTAGTPATPAAPARDPTAYQVPGGGLMRVSSAQLQGVQLKPVTAAASSSSGTEDDRKAVTSIAGQRPRPPTEAEIQAAVRSLRRVQRASMDAGQVAATTAAAHVATENESGNAARGSNPAQGKRMMPAMQLQSSRHSGQGKDVAVEVALPVDSIPSAPRAVKAADLASIRSSVLSTLGGSAKKTQPPAEEQHVRVAVTAQQRQPAKAAAARTTLGTGAGIEGLTTGSGVVPAVLAQGLMAHRSAIAADDDDDWDP